MRLAKVLLGVVFAFWLMSTGVITAGQVKSRESLQILFDNLWQEAILRELTSGKIKPKISVVNLPGNTLARTLSDEILFDPIFFDETDFFQKFAIHHEIGHFVLGHADRLLLLRDCEKNSFEYAIRTECEAYVFAAKMSDDKNLTMFTLLFEEIGGRQTKKDKILSLFLTPAFLVIDGLSSLAWWDNYLFNPLGKYKRGQRVHGLALKKSVLVLADELQSCSCN